MSRTTQPAVVLIDAGPQVAFLNRNDPSHRRVKEMARRLARTQLVTTWPCFTEAMYLLHRADGHAGQDALWLLATNGVINLHDLTTADQQRMRALMAQYADTPMDLADASLVAAAESLALRRVFTLDDDFYIYRLADGSTLEIVR